MTAIDKAAIHALFGTLIASCCCVSPTLADGPQQNDAIVSGSNPSTLSQEAPAFDLWAQMEAGITAAGSQGRSQINFGHLLTDKSRELLVNQILLTAEKPLDPKATDYTVGFKLQGMVGTDARYTHFLGELDNQVHGRTQLDIVEANLQIHTPWLTEGGTDLKIGQFISALGAELIDAGANVFYSKSYIFNFGLPAKHTGFMAINHVNETLDIYAGAISGINTSLGRNGDNNTAWSYQAGIGLNNLLDGKLSVLALGHIGPETPNNNTDLSSIFDVVGTYKFSDSLTFLTELNYIRNDAFKASGYGLAQYVTFALDGDWTASGRAEFWSDADGFYVAAFPGIFDFVNLQKGLPNNAFNFAAGKTNYSEFTAGLTYKPETPPTGIRSLLVRPEIRFDNSLNGTHPFNDGTSRVQFTLGLDIVIKL